MSRKLLSVIYSFLDCIPITQINSLKDCPFWAFFWNSNHAPTPFLTSPSSYVSNVCVPCCFIWLVHVLPKHSSSYSLPHKHLLQELLTSCTVDPTLSAYPKSVDLFVTFMDLPLCHGHLCHTFSFENAPENCLVLMWVMNCFCELASCSTGIFFSLDINGFLSFYEETASQPVTPSSRVLYIADRHPVVKAASYYSNR